MKLIDVVSGFGERMRMEHVQELKTRTNTYLEVERNLAQTHMALKKTIERSQSIKDDLPASFLSNLDKALAALPIQAFERKPHDD
jgi:hypothetical protein